MSQTKIKFNSVLSTIYISISFGSVKLDHVKKCQRIKQRNFVIEIIE